MPGPTVTADQEAMKSDLGEPVRRTVEDTLDGLPEEGADDLVGAGRYKRAAGREAFRAGHCGRTPTTTSANVTPRMPKLRGMRFTAAVTGRYRGREASVGEAMAEVCLAGVSTRRIKDVSEALWGASASNPSERAFATVEEWRSRSLDGSYPYVYVDGIYLKHSWGGSYENVAVMVNIGVNGEGCREAIGAAEGLTESPGCWGCLHSSCQEGLAWASAWNRHASPARGGGRSSRPLSKPLCRGPLLVRPRVPHYREDVPGPLPGHGLERLVVPHAAGAAVLVVAPEAVPCAREAVAGEHQEVLERLVAAPAGPGRVQAHPGPAARRRRPAAARELVVAAER